MVDSKLLVEYGFAKELYNKDLTINQNIFSHYYSYDEASRSFKLKDERTAKELSADEEVYEEVQLKWMKTGYPKSMKRHRIVYIVHDLNVEEPYYWMLKYLKYDAAFPRIDKIEDSFAASEGSAFFGVVQQRIGLQQDKVSQFLAAIGKMVKELFQMVRELRILDERLAYYSGSEEQLGKPMGERRKSDDITLKGIFIDLVQGGAKSAASVYGMSRELEFITLPDLFFDAPPFVSADEMEDYVNRLEFNKKVKEVLKRHLRQFMEWKKRTYSEIKSRRKFTLQYLRQHFDIIKMYIEWAKPYLRNIERLGSRESKMSSPDIITAFESSVIDIEVLASRPSGGYNACILATFNYRTQPSMKFIQEGYQRGPVHVGRMEMNLRSYIWTDEQVENYRRMKEKESFELLKTVSGSIKAAMEALGSEMFNYLEEAGEAKEKESGGEEKKSTESLGRRLFGDFIGPKKKKVRKSELRAFGKDSSAYNEASTHLKIHFFNAYKNFKKGHGMVMW